MTLSRKWATGAADGGDPTGTGTPAAADPNATAALQQEVERLKGLVEQGKAEKSSLEDARQALAQAEARIADLEAGGTPPTPAPQANPYTRLQSEISQYQAALVQNPNDIAVERLLKIAHSELQGWQWQALRQRELPKLAKVPEKFRAKTQELFDTGRFLTLEDAEQAATGFVLRQESEQGAAEIARRKAADEAAARLAAGKPDTGGGSGTESASVTEPKRLTGSEFKKLTATKTPKARELWDQLDAGQLEVDWTC